MFGMAGETDFDLRFQLFGIPVRIHPIFWLSAAFLTWDPDRLDLVFIGVLCVLISVLVHELGHALVSRYYGFPSEIVLYFFGGYATGIRHSTWRDIKVSAAGPGAGFVLFILVYAIWSLLLNFAPGVLREFDVITHAVRWFLFANLVWSVMNLVPCLPLDGGNIMQALVYRYVQRGAQTRVLQISIAASGAVALWSVYCMQQHDQGVWINIIPFPQFLIPDYPVEMLQPGGRFLPIFFGFLCAQSVIAYNQMRTFR